MTKESPPDTGLAPPRRRRRRAVGVLALLLLLPLGLVVTYYAFRGCLYHSLPEDAPRIGISLDDFWLNRTGLTYGAFDIALPRAGGRLVELDIEAAGDPVDPDRVARMLQGIDGLILGGGGDVDPSLYGGEALKEGKGSRHYDDFDLELVRQARARKIPVLGICRGCQILNVAFGGTLRDLHREPEVRARHFLPLQGHALFVEPGRRLARALKETEFEGVMSTHQKGIDRLGEGVRAVAWADEERREVEAIEVMGADWILGVLWHPEREAVSDEMQLNLFRALVAQAKKKP